MQEVRRKRNRGLIRTLLPRWLALVAFAVVVTSGGAAYAYLTGAGTGTGT
ncbi:MAG: hypothetical protein JOZ04_00940, partial [Acidimicrobiia bacterium]|nr:hypothetical protein [Acidimicrobiia bacterium]